jgi:hypothetical protein
MLNKDDLMAQCRNWDVHPSELELEYWAAEKLCQFLHNPWKTHKAQKSSMSSQILV